MTLPLRTEHPEEFWCVLSSSTLCVSSSTSYSKRTRLDDDDGTRMRFFESPCGFIIPLEKSDHIQLSKIKRFVGSLSKRRAVEAIFQKSLLRTVSPATDCNFSFLRLIVSSFQLVHSSVLNTSRDIGTDERVKQAGSHGEPGGR